MSDNMKSIIQELTKAFNTGVSYMLPVVVGVDGEAVLLTPFADRQTACFLISKTGSPFVKM